MGIQRKPIFLNQGENKKKNKTMKKLTVLLALLVTSLALQAGDGKSFKETVVTPTTVFRDVELQVDGFFLQTFAGKTEGQTINTGPGGGFAVNGIFARYFGVGVENAWYSNDNRSNYLLGGYGIFRYPIESLHLAPYALAGGGAGFGKTNYGYASLGIGVEYRFNSWVGTFVDGRWLLGAPDQAGLLRTGLRLAF